MKHKFAIVWTVFFVFCMQALIVKPDVSSSQEALNGNLTSIKVCLENEFVNWTNGTHIMCGVGGGITEVQSADSYIIVTPDGSVRNVSFDETTLNASIDSRTGSTFYNATVIETIYGTPTAGSALANILVINDGLSYNVTEVVGANALLININHTVTDTTFNNVEGRIWYTGGLGHEILLEIWNYPNGVWDEHLEITDQTGFQPYSVKVLDPTSHIQNGIVQTRWRHVQNGNAGHIFRIDYQVLLKGFTSSVTSEHDGLGGRENFATNHPDYAQAINNLTENDSLRVNVAGDEMTGDLIITGGKLNITDSANPVYIMMDYAGISNVNIMNNNSETAAVVGSLIRMTNNEGFWGGLGKTNNHTTLQGGIYNNSLHLYNQGYSNLLITNDGNKAIRFNFDADDNHNFDFVTKVWMYADGNITSTGSICDSNGCIGAGGGTVTQIDTDDDSGIVGGPITATGELYLNSNIVANWTGIASIYEPILTFGNGIDNTAQTVTVAGNMGVIQNADGLSIDPAVVLNQSFARATYVNGSDYCASGEILEYGTGCITTPTGGGGETDQARPAWVLAPEITSNNSIENGNVNISGNVTVFGNDPELDDGTMFYTQANVPYFKALGGGFFFITGGGATGINIIMKHTFDAGGDVSFILTPDNNNSRENKFHVYDRADNKWGTFLRNDVGERQLLPNEDNAYLLGCLSSDAECNANYRWEKIEAVNMGAGDIGFINGLGITECSTKYGRDLCYVGNKPDDNMKITMSLAIYENFTDYQKSHMLENGLYDNSLTETDFNMRWNQTRINGEIDLLLGRNNHGSVRSIKAGIERQEELITILYNKGYLTLQEAMHLRDNF